MLLSLFSLLSALVVGFLLLALTRQITDWSHRRHVQFFVLVLPVLFLVVTLCALPFASQATLPERLMFLIISGLALSALILGIVRIVLMVRFVARHALFMNVALQESINDRIERLLTSSHTVKNQQPVNLKNPVTGPAMHMPFFFLQGLGLVLLTMVALTSCNGAMLLERFL